jgi:pyruvate/2-oxoglutarate/acetoin dehydrogenase E1 component
MRFPSARPTSSAPAPTSPSSPPRRWSCGRSELEKDGVSVEVVDPRTLVPLDEATLLASVRKTHRLVIAHEAVTRCGFGAELAALVAEKALDELDAPIVRVGARPVPMPYNDALERATIPSQADIVAAVRSVL